MEKNKEINSRSLLYLEEFCRKQFPGFVSEGREDKRFKSVTYSLQSVIKKKSYSHVKISEAEYNNLPANKKTISAMQRLKVVTEEEYNALPEKERLIRYPRWFEVVTEKEYYQLPEGEKFTKDGRYLKNINYNSYIKLNNDNRTSMKRNLLFVKDENNININMSDIIFQVEPDNEHYINVGLKNDIPNTYFYGRNVDHSVVINNESLRNKDNVSNEIVNIDTVTQEYLKSAPGSQLLLRKIKTNEFATAISESEWHATPVEKRLKVYYIKVSQQEFEMTPVMYRIKRTEEMIKRDEYTIIVSRERWEATPESERSSKNEQFARRNTVIFYDLTTKDIYDTLSEDMRLTISNNRVRLVLVDEYYEVVDVDVYQSLPYNMRLIENRIFLKMISEEEYNMLPAYLKYYREQKFLQFVSEEEFHTLLPSQRFTKNKEWFEIKENIVWGYSDEYESSRSSDEARPDIKELIQLAIHSKLASSNIPPDASCRFYIGNYMRKSTTKIPPPADDVSLRVIFNFGEDEIYTLDPNYRENGNAKNSGLDQKDVYIGKNMLEMLGPYTMSKYTIKVSSNTTNTRKGAPIRGMSKNVTKIRSANYNRITMVVDFWYPPEMVEKLNQLVADFLEDDHEGVQEALLGLGIKTNRKINKKLHNEKTKMLNNTRRLMNETVDKEFDLSSRGNEYTNIDDFF